jgi:catechol 2,3-dioxygenase
MTSVCERAHDLGLVLEGTALRGRVHHVAFWLDQREDVRTAADVLLESGVSIEFGPGRHGMGDHDYLYFREPGVSELSCAAAATVHTSRIEGR